MPNTLLIFVKNPILGHVKSRLAADIGEEKALAVYLDLVEKTRKETEQLTGVRCVLYYSNFIDKDDEWSSDFFEKRLQSKGDLGDKMQKAFQESSDDKVIIIGSDCYDLQREHIEKAFDKLNSIDIVIGPANDGGYYLLGMKKLYPELFEGVDWSTEKVLTQTLDKIKSLNLSVGFLEELVDLDTLRDLQQSGYYEHFKVFINDRED